MHDVSQPARAWIDFQRVDGRLTVRLGGELDISSLPDVEPGIEELLRDDRQPAVIDMSEVRFMDSSGVALLIRLSNHLGPATIEHPTPLIRRTLEALGLTDRLRIAAEPTRTRRSFPREYQSVPASRRYVAEELKDLPGEVVETATLLVSELATNAVVHGSGQDYELSVSFAPGRGELLISATDAGRGQPRELNPDASEEHGRGLQLVSALADRWGVQSDPGRGTKTVWFRLAVAAPSPAYQ